MPLTSNTKLGQYEVVESIGAGGMGEVYRARDAKLGRDVAIKVLPEEFARDKERLARFEREARLLAQLNHPNIATIHGLEEHEGQQFLIMELVEGETLAERIAQGPVPVDEAIPLFIHIAEGLEAAHEKGIVHRDLKPANIKIGSDGKPKILDFGLAKAFVREQDLAVDSSQSPTLTKGTALGAIMGTASYMSPEQARGEPVDKRSDIWAFACCLFEALTGRKTFAGETTSDVVGSVLRDEPQWDDLAVDTPLIILRLLKRCLVKDRRERVPDIGVARLEIKEALTGSGADLAAARTVARSSMWQRLAPYVATAAGAGLIVWAVSPKDGDAPAFPVRSMVSLGDGVALTRGTSSSLALSPDGRLLVYAATRDGVSQLFSRPLYSFQARPMPGTEGAASPFFSPDGQWIGFFTGGRLKKVSLDAGLVAVICNATSAGGASWAPGNTIIFSTGLGSGLLSVSADGGEPETLTTPDLDRGAVSHVNPHVLPDGKNVLFTLTAGADSRVGLLSLSSGEWVELELPGARGLKYAASGHLIYGQAGGLSAAAFDVEQLKVVGSSVPVVGNVATSSLFGTSFALSDNGTLVYAAERSKNELVWVDRQGVMTTLLDTPGVYLVPRVSPDGRRLALAVLDPSAARRSLWIYDLARTTLTRLTSDDTEDDATDPAWSPDGTRIAYASRLTDGVFNVFVKAVDGAAEPIQLTSERTALPTSWSPDGQSILFHSTSAGLYIVSTAPGHPAEPLLTGHDQYNGTLSPDERWLAFDSSESGRREIYVSPYPALDRGFLVSTAGGAEPRWSGNGRELFYREGDKMMAVDVRLEGDFSASQPRVLFEGPFATDPVGGDAVNYDVTSDERFVMVRETERTSELYMVLNWHQELERLVPTN